MSGPNERIPNTLRVLEQFTDTEAMTLSTAAERSGLPEPTVHDCLERLVDADLLVKCREGTSSPVWKTR
jgi:DNA-binding IclR family transcriptional regulator